MICQCPLSFSFALQADGGTRVDEDAPALKHGQTIRAKYELALLRLAEEPPVQWQAYVTQVQVEQPTIEPASQPQISNGILHVFLQEFLKIEGHSPFHFTIKALELEEHTSLDQTLEVLVPWSPAEAS